MSAIFGEVLTFGQANGADVRLRVFGDEHYARYEDLNGYTVVYDDELGLFCYARLAAGSVPLDRRAAITDPPPAGLVRHLQEAQEVVVRQGGGAQAAARRRRPAAAAKTSVVRTFGPNQGLLEGRVLLDRHGEGPHHPGQFPGRYAAP